MIHGDRKVVFVCGDTGCLASHSSEIKDKLDELVRSEGLQDKIKVLYAGCFGLCSQGPFIRVYPEGTLYRLVKPSDAALIFEKDLKGNGIVESLVFKDPVTGALYPTQDQIPFYQKQKAIAMVDFATIEPDNIEHYMGIGGYEALAHVLENMTSDHVIQTALDSGLRGRGGGGYPTGVKWRYARMQSDPEKYLICNLDEGDPGAFMDRAIAERTPHIILEGMMIAAYGIGAIRGFIYVRAEYPTASKRLQEAIELLREKHLLGNHILGTDFSFDVEIRVGAGAFVCGEETALMSSIEGKRGMPRSKPPFPAVKGLWDHPTIINNAETFANIPFIYRPGGLAKYQAIGTEKSKGTKVFSLAGKIKNVGLVEVPMGTTLRELIFDIGGGIANNKKFKAIQTGGPSGGCLVEEDLDTPIDFDNLIARGSMMGSGGAIVMDEDNCMVDVARFYLDFICDESCGKCTPCRVGTTRMKEILDKIAQGKAEMDDLTTLKELALFIKDASLCGLGQTAPNPVLSTLNKFYDEYKAHIVDRTCPAKVCKDLLKYYINPDQCKKCGICAAHCPVGAITGVRGKEPFVINQTVCVKCGTCLSSCPFDVIRKI
ncbi:MAG: NADH-ubiquinone oxidoreductase-F iron-sulfur binding region domain-containing protein [Bacilli bacterium]